MTSRDLERSNLESNISKTAGFRDSVTKDITNIDRKWHMGYQIVTRQMKSRDPEGAVRQYGRLY